MHAVVMREFGPPEVLQPAEIAEVTAAPGEVVIDVQISGVTFVETQIRPTAAWLGQTTGRNAADRREDEP